MYPQDFPARVDAEVGRGWEFEAAAVSSALETVLSDPVTSRFGV